MLRAVMDRGVLCVEEAILMWSPTQHAVLRHRTAQNVERDSWMFPSIVRPVKVVLSKGERRNALAVVACLAG